MAGSSLFALIDDIASVLDDVALLTKLSAKKTAGVLGDDLALNAQQVAGVAADRELPVVFAVAKGSAVNKLILVPSALIISAIAPWAVLPLLMVGGLFLCYEGCEKIVHRILHDRRKLTDEHRAMLEAVADARVDLVELEKLKIRGAVRTDFVLSAEIIVITLGEVAQTTLTKQILVLSGIAVIMTFGVYGLVAAIVKLDDLGYRLESRTGSGMWSALKRRTGRLILRMAPRLMKTLSIAGTVAMFLVGGGILTHAVPVVDAWIHRVAERAAAVPGFGGVLGVVTGMALNGLCGLLAGFVALLILSAISACWRKLRGQPATTT